MSLLNEITAYLGQDWILLQEMMRDSLSSTVGLLNNTNSEVLSASGKHLRPMISLLTSRALGEVNRDSLSYAAACELLHNATLMHDDVTDKSAERRGRPTVSALLGPSAAVLVADFWLAKAVELVMSTERHERAAKFFCKTLSDLSEGEMLQMEKAGTADTTEEDYYTIIHGKTASLFEVCGIVAADSVGASEEQFEAARLFACNFGMAFQIKDDILDYAGSDNCMGKPVGVDLKEQKITLPLLGAMKGSEREEEIRRMVREIPSAPENCGKIRDFVAERDGIGYATARLDSFVEGAKRALQGFPDTPARDYLAQIADFNVFRQV